MNEELLTITEARKIIKVGVSKIYQLFHEGKLKPVRLGRRTMLTRTEINRFIEDLYQLGPEDWAKYSKHLPPL